MSRPMYPKPDKTSHAAVRAWLLARGCTCAKSAAKVKWYYGGYYAGMPLAAIDISSNGGMVDWLLILNRSAVAAWECKEPGKENDLTEAEREFSELMDVYIIVTPEDCEAAVEQMVRKM